MRLHAGFDLSFIPSDLPGPLEDLIQQEEGDTPNANETGAAEARAESMRQHWAERLRLMEDMPEIARCARARVLLTGLRRLIGIDHNTRRCAKIGLCLRRVLHPGTGRPRPHRVRRYLKAVTGEELSEHTIAKFLRLLAELNRRLPAAGVA